MKYRLRTLTILLSCASATGFAIQFSWSNFFNDSSTKKIASPTSEYLYSSFYDPIVAGRFQQASFYIKLVRSENFNLRQHGLTHLARFQRLPPLLYVLLGQQIDFRQLIRLARTFEANNNLFPRGPPFVFRIDQNKTIVSTNPDDFDDDQFLSFTVRAFIEKLDDDRNRPIDTLAEHYRNSLKNYFEQVDSRTVFDLFQHFESEHADISAKAIRRYRSNLELYSTFLYALRGYADRYPNEVVCLNGLQILKYLYEKRRDNVPFVCLIGKILLLLSRDERTHRAFCAVGWLKILHELLVDQKNVVYSLLASTILSNLDRTNEQCEEIPSDSRSKFDDFLPVDLLEEKIEEPKENSTKNRFRQFIDRVKSVRKNEKKIEKNFQIESNRFEREVFGDKVILLSPTFYNVSAIEPDVRWNREFLVDVVFLHGLAGSAFKTWRDGSSEDTEEQIADKRIDRSSEETNWLEDDSDENLLRSSSCWPKDWLGKDLPSNHIRMIAVDYESRVSEWQIASLPKNVLRRSMFERAREISEQLKQAGIGKRPIVWVAHSMGGLLTKYILTDEQNQSIRQATKACVFFSVPHFGAELASYGVRHAFFVRPTIEIHELHPNSENLMKLHKNFLEFIEKNNELKILSFAENEKTTFSLRYQTVIVPSESSKLDVGKFFVLNKNHILICKPDSKSTVEYEELRELIENIFLQSKTEPRKEPEEFLENTFLFSSPIEDDFGFRY